MAHLVGAHAPVPCLDGGERPYRDLDCAASTPALQSVADRVTEFLPWYSSVHRGAGYKSRRATGAYEAARESVHRFAGRPPGGDDVVVLVPQHDRGHQPPGLPPPARTRRRGGHHRGRAPRQPAAVGPGGGPALGRVRHRRHIRHRRRHLRARRRAAPGAAGPHRCLERHRVDAPDRRDLRRGARARHAGAPGRGAARPAPAAARRGPTSWPSAGTSSTRPSAPAHSSGRDAPSRPATRSWPAAARSTWSTSTRSSGPSPPNARRPVRPTWSARSPSAPPWTSWSGSAGTRSARTSRRSPPRLHEGLRALEGVHVLGPRTARAPVTATGSPSRPSPWPACTTRWSRPA